MKSLSSMVFLFVLATLAAFAVESTIPTDTVKIGKKESANDVSLEFNNGNGANNPALKSTKALNDLRAKTTKLSVGKGAAEDIKVVFDNGAGTNSPSLEWSNTDQKILFSNDGITKKAIGSGSGTGGAGFSVLENPGFEDGLAKWSYTAGTETVASSGSNLLFELKSAVFDAAASGEYIQTDLYTIPEGLKGRNCEGSIVVKGGDANLKLKVVDGSSATLAEKVLQTETGAIPNGVTFICPTSGSIRLRVEATAAALPVALDKAHLGEFSTFQISTATWVGSVKFGTDCVLARTGSTYGDMTDASCTTTAIGNVAALSGVTAGVRVLSGQAGRYLAVVSGGVRDATADLNTAAFIFTDATSGTWGEGQVYANTTNAVAPTFQAGVTKTSGFSNLDVKLQCLEGGGGTCQLVNFQNFAEISIYFFPSQSETAVRIGAEFTSAKMYQSADQVIGAGITKVNLDTALFNFGGIADTANTRILIKEAGQYSIKWVNNFYNIASANEKYTVLRKNGSNACMSTNGSTTSTFVASGSCELTLAKGDYLEVFAASNGGNATVGSGYNEGLTVTKLTQQTPQVVTLNSISHEKANQQRVIRGVFTGGPSPAIYKAGTPDWSVAKTGGTGEYTITFNPPFNGTDISCYNGNEIGAGNSMRTWAYDPTALTASTLIVWAYQQDGSGSNTITATHHYPFVCIGDK